MILGNIEKFKGTGLVAFLDILGFSKEIEEHWDAVENNPLDRLLELKRNLPIYNNNDIDPQISKSKTHRRYHCRVQTISDSIVVSFGFDDPLQMGDLVLGTYTFFDTIRVIWNNCLATGYTIRGAVDFGKIYWDEKEIIGPSFITAYKLEVSHAKTSRVILSSNINRNMAQMFAQQATMWDKFVFRFLRKDIDGYIIFNPHELYSGEEEKTELIRQIEGIRGNAKGLTGEKYSPLLACLQTKNTLFFPADLGHY
jgi:hypothetical protein